MLNTQEQSICSLDDYDLVREVGRGRQCVVYEAVCRRGRMCNRLLALKKVTLLGSESSNRADRLLIECSKMQQELHHPNILSVYSAFSLPGIYVQILEYCPGGSLTEYIQCNGPLPLLKTTSLLLFRGLSNALAYFKDHQIVHRAIHPRNIYLDSNQRPKLSCFDDAIRLPSNQASVLPSTEFTAPEIAQGSTGGYPADIWSLASVVYYLLNGRPPQISDKLTMDTATRSENCDPQLREVLIQMLSYAPSDRLSIDTLVIHPVFSSSLKVTANKILPPPPPRDMPIPERKTLAPARYENILEQRPRVWRIRRASLGDVRNHQLNDIKNLNRGALKDRATKRNVSDPTPSYKVSQGRTISGLARDNGILTLSSNDRAKISPQLNSGLVSPVPGIHHATCIGAREPYTAVDSQPGANGLERIDSSLLRPQSQRVRDGRISVLHNKHILVDFRNSSTINEVTKNKVMVIDPRQDLISVFEEPTSQDPCHLSILVHQCSREALPSEFWDQYRAASVAIDQVKQRTPKVITFTGDGKYTQMINGPPSDVEAMFSPAQTTKLHQDNTILRIHYSESRGLVELRRYAGGLGGELWVKKCITSISDPKEIPQSEWARLDDFEKHGLRRLFTFAETCKTIENLGLTMQSPLPLQDGSQVKALPSATVAEDIPYVPSVDPFPQLLIPRRPNKLI